MRKSMNRLLAILLIFAMVIPSLAIAENNINIDYVQEGNSVLITINSRKNQDVSITIKDNSRYYYIDQGTIGDSGRIEFETTLEDEKTYDCLVNIAGDTATKKIVMEKSKLDPEPELPIVDKVDLYIRGYKGMILNQRNIEIKKNESAMGLTTRILDDNNIKYRIRSGYMISIDNQSEFDRGKDSGWMFSINGEFLNLSASSVRLRDGDSIRWLYTENLGEDVGAPTYSEDSNLEDLTKSIDEALDVINNKNSSDSQIIKSLDNIDNDLQELASNQKVDNIKDTLKEAAKVSDLLITASDRENSEELSVKIADSAIKVVKLLDDLVEDRADKETIEDISKISANNVGIALNSIAGIKDNNKISKMIEDMVDVSLKVEDRLARINHNPDKETEKSIRINLIEDKNKGEIILPHLLLEQSNKQVETIKLSFLGSVIEVDSNNLYEETQDDLKIRLEKDQGSTSIKFEENGKELKEVERPIKATLLYDSKVSNRDNIRVVLVMEDGSREIIGGVYDDTTKSISFLTHKLGRFVVEENSATQFEDLSAYNWAQESINAMATKGIINGKTENEFHPAANITRAEFSALVSRVLKYNEGLNEEIPFKDVSKDKWYYESILTSYRNGLINGKSLTEFDPEGYITREEITKIIGNVLVNNKYKIKESVELEKFNDNSNIVSWAKEEAATATYHGIIRGDNNSFNPKNNATRAETAVILYRLYELIL